MKHYRRVGKIIPLRRPEPPEPRVHASDAARMQKIEEWSRILSRAIYDRLSAIDEDDTSEILAELQAQAIVIGGVARRARDTLPGDTKWVDPMADWYADWLKRTQRF